MRVLHLTRDLAPRARGGVSTAVAGMVRALTAAGVECAVISFDDWRPTRRGGAAVEDAGRVLRLSGPDALPAAEFFARDFRPEIAHVHADLLWPFAAGLGVPTALSVHVLHAEQNRVLGIAERTLSLAAQERALAAAEVVLAPSRAVAALVPGARLAPLGVDDAPPGVADALLADAPATPHAGVARAGVLYAGRFADIKGTDVFFAAAARLDARCIAAGGVPGNPRAENRWRRRAGAVECLGWLDDLAPLYTRAAVVAVPSRFETFGQSALEAMRHGAPVVASRAGALPELVEHGVTGLLVPPGDPDALAAAVASLLADPARAAALGAAAAARVRERHLWRHALPALLDAYARLR